MAYFLRTNEDGSALVAVLVMIVVLTTLVGAVLSLYVARHRFVVRDVHRTQALYEAEGAIHAGLARISEQPDWQRQNAQLSERTTIAARAYGGYWQLHSEAKVGRQQASVTALVGISRPNQFESAFVFGDPRATLSLAGSVEIDGDLLVGPRGTRYEMLAGRPFRGEVRGEIVRGDSVQFPEFDEALFAETLDRAERYLDLIPSGVGPAPEHWSDAVETELEIEWVFEDSLQVYIAGDRGALTGADTSLLSSPILLLAGGDIEITGSVALMPGSQIMAAGAVSIVGQFSAHDVLIVGERIEVNGFADIQGQLISRKHLALDGGAFLRYPSIAYVAGENGQSTSDQLTVGTATVEGHVIHVAGEGLPPGSTSNESVRLYVGENALVRGAVYCARRLELHGRVEGTVITYQTYFFRSPSSYVNWLADGEIVQPARPNPFMAPVGLGNSTRFEIVEHRSSVQRAIADAD